MSRIPGRPRRPRVEVSVPPAAETVTAGPDGTPAGEPRPGRSDADPAVRDDHPGGPEGRRAVRGFLRRRRPLVVAAGTVVGAVILASIGDVVLEHVARGRIARAAACELRPAGAVRASLSGSLAGLRLLTGRVGSVRIEADDVRRQGLDIAVAAELRGVTTKGSMRGGTATATIPYDQLRSRMGTAAAGLRPSGDGRGGLLLTGTAAGVPLPVTVRTRITTSGDAVTVTPLDVSVFGADFPVAGLAAQPATRALAGQLAPRTVQVPPLPSGVRLTGARAGADGLDLTLSVSRTATGSGHNGCVT